MMKIIVVGPSGSGKSTFSRKLHEQLGIPLYHMDQLFWKKNWEQESREVLIEKLEAIFPKKCWIIDGNYGGTLEMRLQEADVVFYLDFPRRVYFPRTILRVLKNYGKTRADMTEGCVEHFDWEFIKYVWNFDKQNAKVLKLLDCYKDKVEIVRFSKQRDVDEYLLERV